MYYSIHKVDDFVVEDLFHFGELHVTLDNNGVCISHATIGKHIEIKNIKSKLIVMVLFLIISDIMLTILSTEKLWMLRE